MQKIIPVYYSEYGRYINRFRAIPFYVDCLKPVERRILLVLHQIGKNKLVKSAKIVGTCIAGLHPHGDQSVYSSLVNLVEQGYVNGKGNWGSPGLVDASAAAYRYTECKLSKWIEELAFEYIDFVPWENLEFEDEPVYLPSPIPIGLIGHGVITGISFYKTLIPKYKLADLAKRLIWLIDNEDHRPDLADLSKLNIKKAGPIIEPNINDCYISEDEENQFLNLLINGIGSINIIPNGKIDGKNIKILGRAPNASFNSLAESKDKLEIYLNCLSKKTIDIEITPRKRSTNLNDLGSKIWNNYLSKKMNFNCITCDMDGSVNTIGIDDILLNNYQAWKYAVLLKNVNDYNKLNDKKIELIVVQMIRYIFEKYNSNKVSEIIIHFKELLKENNISVELEKYNVEAAKWQNEDRQISEQDIINVCNKKNIRSLIETTIDIKKVETEILDAKITINTVDKNCYKYIKNIS